MNDDADSLLSMFSRLGTTDHDVLIQQFQTILPGIATEVADFFLSASDWVLAQAISAYFDNAGGQDMSAQLKLLNRPKPMANFQLQDDGVIQYPADSSFSKQWLVTNSGNIPWPESCTLEYITGDQLGGPRSMPAPSLAPGQTIDVSLTFRTPSQPGDYAGSWQMSTNEGEHSTMFGEPIWVCVNVIANPNQVTMGWGVQQPQQQFQQFQQQQFQQPQQFQQQFQQPQQFQQQQQQFTFSDGTADREMDF
jgi:hypothetical protein